MAIDDDRSESSPSLSVGPGALRECLVPLLHALNGVRWLLVAL